MNLSHFCHMQIYHNSDTEEENGEESIDSTVVRRSRMAPCAPESTLMSKKRRYASWLHNPQALQTDLATYHATISCIQSELELLEHEEVSWVASFEDARRHFIASLNESQREVSDLRQCARSLLDMCHHECGTSRKRRSSNMVDIINEFESRQQTVENLLEEYLETVNEMISKKDQAMDVTDAPVTDPFPIPIVSVTIDAIESPEDMHCHRLRDVPVLPPAATHLPLVSPWSTLRNAAVALEAVEPSPPDLELPDSPPPRNMSPFSAISSAVTASNTTRSPSMHAAAVPGAPSTNQSTGTSTSAAAAGGKSKQLGKRLQIDVDDSLLGYFAAMEERLRHSKNIVAAIEGFLPEDYSGEEMDGGADSLPYGSGRLTQPASQSEKMQFAEQLLDCSDEATWLALLRERTQPAPTKKKRRTSSSAKGRIVPVLATAFSLTPRDQSLLMCPLSRLPDRVVGVVYGVHNMSKDNATFQKMMDVRNSFLTPEMILAESELLEKDCLQAQLVRARNAQRKIMSSVVAWEQRVKNGEDILTKNEQSYNSAVSDYQENARRCHKQLVYKGIVPSNMGEILSPIAATPSAYHGIGRNRPGRGIRRGANNRSAHRPIGFQAPVQPVGGAELSAAAGMTMRSHGHQSSASSTEVAAAVTADPQGNPGQPSGGILPSDSTPPNSINDAGSFQALAGVAKAKKAAGTGAQRRKIRRNY